MTTDALASPAPSETQARDDLYTADVALSGLYLYPLAAPASEDDSAEPQYRWRRRDAGEWFAMGEGDINQLVAEVSPWPAQVILVLPGHQVVTRRVAVAPGERRYYKKLVPFQLEDDIVTDVTELHFVFGPLDMDAVDLAYCQRRVLDTWLTPFYQRELPVSHIVSAAALLPVPAEGEWLLLRDDAHLYYRLSETRYGTVQPSLAGLFLGSLVARNERPQALQLLASTPEQLTELRALLPASLAPLVANQRLASTPLAAHRQTPNLAVDQYFPRIPLKRWLSLVKVPALLLGAGLAVHLLVALTEWHTASRHTDELKTAITERYRAAVPVGAISDPLKQLRNQVNRAGNSSQGSNALQVLSQTVPVLTAIDGVEVKNLQFVNDAQELRLTIQAPALADIESLSSQFKGRGYDAQVLSVNVNNGVHQARMKVTRK